MNCRFLPSFCVDVSNWFGSREASCSSLLPSLSSWDNVTLPSCSLRFLFIFLVHFRRQSLWYNIASPELPNWIISRAVLSLHCNFGSYFISSSTVSESSFFENRKPSTLRSTWQAKQSDLFNFENLLRIARLQVVVLISSCDCSTSNTVAFL